MSVLGKYEDAGKLVDGGRIDQHWQGDVFINTHRVTGESTFVFDKKFLDTNEALKHYALRSIEYGNWMNQEDRANFLYGSMLSLSTLSNLFGISEKQTGLNERLSIALGARGSGGAAAHYEAMPYSVINITKTKGFGSFAHEYGHAIDNILSYYTKTTQSFVSGGRTTRKWVDQNILDEGNYFEQQFELLLAKLFWNEDGTETSFHTNIDKLPEYWNRRNEVFARTFETYVFYLMQEKGISNNFLSDGYYPTSHYPSEQLIDKVSPILKTIIKGSFQLFEDKALSGISTKRTLKNNAKLQDTLFHMKRIVMRDYRALNEFSEQFRDVDVEQTARNIWGWMRANTQYKLDEQGKEQLRTPQRSLKDRNIGIDCDDYSILISSILMNLGIAHEFRVAAYKEKGRFQHIYPVAFDEEGNDYVIDCVPEIPQFNYEASPIIDLKTVTIMELQELSGVKEREAKQDLLEELNLDFELSGIEEDDYSLEKSFLHGFAEVSSEADADIVIAGADDVADVMEKGFLAEINKARNLLIAESNRPTVLSKTIDVRKELSIMNEVMDSFDDAVEREEVLQEYAASNSAYKNFYKALLLSLRQLETEELNGFDDEPIYLAQVDMENYDLAEVMSESVDGLGKLRLRKFFKKIGKGLKKAAKAVVKFNPATITMRAATLVVLKTNLFKIASRLIYGYLTESQANAENLNLTEWRKLVDARKKAENFYVKMGGKASKFKDAIVKGKAAKKTGLQLGVAATATTTAAASGFIAFAKKILKAINPKNLFNKIKNKSQKDGNNTFADESDFDAPESKEVTTEFNQENNSPVKMTRTTNTDEQEIILPDSEPKGVVAKMKSFFTTHKKKIMIVGVGAVVAIVSIFVWKKHKQKTKRSLAGVKAARTRKRNAKKSTRSYKRRTPALRGSTTILKVPTKSIKKTRVTKRSNANRLKLMHKKAKQLQKQQPRAKYSTLLKKVSKMI